MATDEMPNESPNNFRQHFSSRFPTNSKEKIIFIAFLVFAVIGALLAAIKVVWGFVRVIMYIAELADTSNGIPNKGSSLFGLKDEAKLIAGLFQFSFGLGNMLVGVMHARLKQEAMIVFANVFLLIATAIGVFGLFTRKQLFTQVYLIVCIMLYLQNLDWIPMFQYTISPTAFLVHANLMALFELAQIGTILAVFLFEV